MGSHYGNWRVDSRCDMGHRPGLCVHQLHSLSVWCAQEAGMNAVFADAGYWIALFNPRDQLHTKALTVSNTLQGRPLVTSQMVLTEFLNHYAALGQPFRQRAVQVVRSLQDDPD